MKETTDTLNDPSQYPSARHMATHNTSDDNLSYNQNKPTLEITLCHDQWMETPVGNMTSQQQQHLPSVRCTLCKDQDNKVIFYRPYMALHTLFQTPDLDGPPTTGTTRYSMKRYTQDSLDSLPTADGTSGDTTEQDPQRLAIPKQRQQYVTLYNATNDQALWTLTEQDWDTMTFVSRQAPHTLLMTTSTFSFVWENRLYQWRMQLGEEDSIQLVCEECDSNQTKRRVAWLRADATRLTLVGNAHRPLATFLVLSGLILHELIHSQVRTLGGGRDVMVMMIERQQLALTEEIAVFYQDQPTIDEETPSRWSSTSSLKSLELDQGWWQCWWSWIPCCMPGSWCDRAWIKTRGVRRYHHRSRVTRRMQGWQQQN